MSLSPKDPAEIIVVTFDFAALAASISAPVISASTPTGVIDPTPNAIISGSAQVVDATVMQRITGGVAGANYHLDCQIDTPDGLRYMLSAVLPVREL